MTAAAAAAANVSVDVTVSLIPRIPVRATVCVSIGQGPSSSSSAVAPRVEDSEQDTTELPQLHHVRNADGVLPWRYRHLFLFDPKGAVW